MKIALVVTGGLHPSGREQVIPALLSLVEHLARAHDVHAYVLRHLPQPGTYQLAGATIHDLGRPRGRWAQWRGLRQAVRHDGPFDVLHALWVDPAGVAAALAGRALGVPVLVTCDSGEFTALPDCDYGLQRHWRGRAAVRIACGLAARVHVTTQFMEALAMAHGYSAVRIPIGIDATRVAAPAARTGRPPWRLLQIASLNRVKDHATLLRALAIVRRSVDARLDLVGEDTLGGRLQADAAALGLADAVQFHGFVPHDALAPFHQRAHVYVQSSRHEGGGIAVLEAAAAGVPIVGTRVGYVSDWAPRGAVAVAPGDDRALAAAILQVLQDHAHREAITHSARAFAMEHNVDWSAARLTALYRAMVGRQESPAQSI